MLTRIQSVASKREKILLARHFGYGVPRLSRALFSAQNDLALVAEAYIRPFKRERKADADGVIKLQEPAFAEIHYYDLPWPKKALEALGSKNVQMKVTLSYFIEPAPGELAPVLPARYQSFGLRFELKRATDTEEVFRQRINALERAGAGPLPTPQTDSRWTFGVNSVAAGSLHCDTWVGPAIELAARGKIAVYPVGGWWRYRKHLERCNSVGRYALIVSITADDEDVELYTEIANQIGLVVSAEVSV
jgi:hypothetical protein